MGKSYKEVWNAYNEKKKSKTSYADVYAKWEEEQAKQQANNTVQLPTRNNTVNLPISQNVSKNVQKPTTNKYSRTQNVSTKKSIQDTANKFVENRKEEAKDPVKKGRYVWENLGSGVTGGLVGIAQAGFTDIANQAQKGQEESIPEAIVNSLPIISDIKNIGKRTQILTDKNKNGWQKVSDYVTTSFSDALNMIPGKKEMNLGIKLASKLNPKLSEKALNANDIISKPIDEKRSDLAQEGQYYDKVTQKVGQVGQVIGNMLPSIAATAITKNPNIGLAAMGISAKGQATQEALNKGASLEQAVRIGDTKGAIEVLTEKITSGLSIFGKGVADDVIEDAINKGISNRFINYVTKKGVGIAGEIGEETLSDLAGLVIDKGSIDPDATYTWQDWLDMASTTILSTGALNALSGEYSRSAYQQNVNEMQQYLAKESLKQNIEDSKLPEADKKQMLDYLKNNEITEADYNAMKKTLGVGQENTNTEQNLKQTAINEINNAKIADTEKTQMLDVLNSLSEPIQKNNFKYEKSDNSKIDTFRQDASKYWNNTEKTIKLVNTIEKIINDKGYNIRLDNTLGDNVNGRILTNNQTGETEITINPNSNRTGEFIIGHELTHAIQTQEMVDLINERMQKDGELRNAVEDLKKLYGTDDINAEVLADISGQLFGNQEFINNLSVEKPSVFKRIYDAIVSLANKITGNSSEALFIKDLRNKWEKAYRSNTNQINDAQYSTNNVLPKNVKEIKNMNEFLRKAMESETDKTWKQRLRDAYFSGSEMIFKESPLKRKRELVGQYLEYKNNANVRYSLSENTTTDNQGRTLTTEQQERYKDISDELKDENGNIKRYYHGTQRGDRVGNIFDPNKATSGPMAFFTDSPEIAESYSKNKQDTSLSRDYDTEWDLFKANNNNLDTYWRLLSENKRNEIRQKGFEAGLDEDYNVAFGKDMSKNSFGDEYKYLLQRNNNNALKALYEIYVNSGNLWQEEIRQFKDVLDYVGVENVSYLDPYKTDNKVYEVYLNIKNPFNTDNSNKILNQLEEYSKKVKYNPDEAYAADMWDKTNISPSDWIEYLKDDIKEGTTHSWTRIPDWVTDFLKSKGYDGIVDRGGKHGGVSHQVAIPFYSEQIKNIDNTNPTDNPDIRYSKQNQTWQDYLENNYKAEGTRTPLGEIKLPTQSQLNNVTEEEKPSLPTSKNTPGESINWNEIERPEGKFRKHYQSIIQSSNTTAEAKAIAKEMMGSDTYIPQSNKELLSKADARIGNTSPETELSSLLSKALNNEKVNDIDIAVGERLIEYYSKTGDSQKLLDAIHATAMAGTQAGRTVQAMAILNHMTPQGQVVWLQRSIDKANNQLQQKYKNKQEIPQFTLTEDMTNRLLQTDSKEEMYDVLDDIYEELGEQVPKGLAEQIDEWRYFSMLANIKTHARNVIGNVAMGGVQRLKNKVAGVIEGAVAKVNPNIERTHTIRRASEEVKNFAKNDVNNMDVQTELGMNENKYNPQSRLQNARKTFKSDTLNNTLGKMFDFNSKMLEVEDNIGLKAAYINSLSNYLTANNIDVKNISDAQLQKARLHAINEAQEATFHQASALATLLNQLGRKNNLGKFALDAIVPFKKTPINVAKTGIQYSPVGLVKSAVYDVAKVRNGSMTINKYIDNVSKGLTGTGITLMGYALAQAGILKASGDEDDKKETYDEEQGKQPYSLEIGGKSASLDWLSPVGIPLFIGAEISQQFNQTKKEKTSKSTDDNKLLNQIINRVGNMGTAFSNAIQPMSEMSMISGLTSVLSSYNKEAAAGNMFANSVKSYINQFVPTALSQVARTTDEYERTTKSTKSGILPRAIDTTVNQIKSKIPGLRQTLPTKTNIWGKDVEQSQNLPFRAFNNFINPAIVKDVSSDKVDKELNKLYANTKDSSIIPKSINKNFSQDGQEYVLTNKEYADYNKMYGETAYNLIKGLVNSSNYDKLTTKQKQKAIEEIYKYSNEKYKNDYMDKNKIKYDPSTLSSVVDKLDNVGKSNYFEYLAKTQGIDKRKEKLEVLSNASYSNKTKKIIYENSIGEDDDLYNNVMKKSNIDMTEYLKYKTQEFVSDKKDDGTIDGKSISGSKKKKVLNYINNMSSKVTYEQKLLLAGTQYKLSNAERAEVAKYVNSLNIKKDEKLDIYKKLQGFTVYKNGTIKF